MLNMFMQTTRVYLVEPRLSSELAECSVRDIKVTLFASAVTVMDII